MIGVALFGGKLKKENLQAHSGALLKVKQLIFHHQLKIICLITELINNLVELLKKIKEEKVTIVGDIEEYEYGKFGCILDPEGNKIELW